MTALHATRLLETWEECLPASGPLRSLRLLAAVLPELAPEQLAALSVGASDARLLALHEALFGRALEGVVRCEACGERFELRLDTRDLRLPFDVSEAPHALCIDDYALRFRSVCCADLLALRTDMTPVQAEQTLLARCLLTAERAGAEVEHAALPAQVVEALSRRMSELDPQAEIVLDVACASCGHAHAIPLNVSDHVWAKLDRWARGLLREVDQLARAYGWSERSILRMSAGRRGAYLAQLAEQP